MGILISTYVKYFQLTPEIIVLEIMTMTLILTLAQQFWIDVLFLY